MTCSTAFISCAANQSPFCSAWCPYSPSIVAYAAGPRIALYLPRIASVVGIFSLPALEQQTDTKQKLICNISGPICWVSESEVVCYCGDREGSLALCVWPHIKTVPPVEAQKKAEFSLCNIMTSLAADYTSNVNQFIEENLI